MPDDVEQPIDYCGIVVMDDDADDVELTEALERAAINLSDAMTGGGVFAVHGRRADEVAARIQRREEGIMSSLITLNNILREIDKRRKGHAARTPSPVSVEEVARAIQRSAQEDGNDSPVDYGDAEGLAKVAIAALSTRP
jgi:hypothetical protein